MLPILVRNFLVKHPELIYCIDARSVLSNKQIEDGCIDIEYSKHKVEEDIFSEITHNGVIIIRTLDNGSETIVAGRAYYVNMEDYIRKYLTEKFENMAKQIELTKDTMCPSDPKAGETLFVADAEILQAWRLILDTHLGSGSSRIAAYQFGFDFVGTEIDKEYYESQEKRFQTFKTDFDFDQKLFVAQELQCNQLNLNEQWEK